MSQIAEAFVRVRAEYDAASFRKGAEQVTRSSQQLSRSLKDGERDFGRFARGAAVGSGAVHGLGRSIAFASASFLGAYGFVSVLRTSIETAEHFEKASHGLDAQLKTLGISSTSAAPLIAKTNAQMANLGITADQSEEALGRLIRATGNVSRATKLMGLTADLAAARHIGLSQAALLVGKVVQGTTTAFNRFGIVIKAGTSVTDALTIAQKKLAGQAEANVTPLERLHAAVTNIEAAVGTQLLPTVNNIATALNHWLSSSKNQERIQRDVAKAVQDGTAILGGFYDVLKTVKDIVTPLTDLIGGLKNAVELLVSAALAAKLVKFASGFTAIGGAATTSAAEVGVATTAMEADLAGVGTAATVARGKAGGAGVLGLGSALRGLPATIGVTILVETIINRKKISGFFDKHGLGFLNKSLLSDAGVNFGRDVNAIKNIFGGGSGQQSSGSPAFLGADPITLLLQATDPNAIGPSQKDEHALTAVQNRVRSRLATRAEKTAVALAAAQAVGTRAGITAATNARLAYIKDTIAFAKRLMSQGRGNTGQLETTLQSLYGEQGSDQGILSQFTQDDANAASKRAAAAKAKADKVAAAAAKQAAVVKANAEKVLRAVKAANKLRADQLNATLAAGRAYTYSFVTGLGAIGAANRKAAAAKAARVAGRAADASEATLLGLQNTLAEDDLINNPAKRLAKQKKDEENLVLYYQRIVHTLEKQKKGLLAINQAKANVISAQVALHSLSTSTSATGGFTLQQLFAEAGSELQQYGSNVGAGPLSPQDAEHVYKGIVKSSATTVHQHFYGSRPTGQALADARAVARNSK